VGSRPHTTSQHSKQKAKENQKNKIKRKNKKLYDIKNEGVVDITLLRIPLTRPFNRYNALYW